MKIYILQSEDGLYLNKELEWSAAADANSVFRSEYKDVVLNQLIELNAKDITLRANVVACEPDSRGRPVLVSQSEAASNHSDNASDAA